MVVLRAVVLLSCVSSRLLSVYKCNFYKADDEVLSAFHLKLTLFFDQNVPLFDNLIAFLCIFGHKEGHRVDHC